MTTSLTDAEVNHLRRLLGWVACEIGQAPDEMVATVRQIVSAIGSDVSQEGKARLILAHQQASNVPKYVRAAVKALRKTIEQTPEPTTDPRVVAAEVFVRDVLENDPGPEIVRRVATKVMKALPP